MRMWMIDPTKMCNRHLVGEHGEIHKHRHNFVKGHSVSGRLSPVVQIEPSSMRKRHDDLAAEMLSREMNHKSPYDQPPLDHYDEFVIVARVDIDNSIEDLSSRCNDCKMRLKESDIYT